MQVLVLVGQLVVKSTNKVIPYLWSSFARQENHFEQSKQFLIYNRAYHGIDNGENAEFA